ncbi:hypothetical protein BGAL_0361g00070 [Botrytis galanthina]|uniref:Uncharacterized protein n=1 Tax=Botrytis galanthina TaxID=278940 RepID=A0A4S8QYK8_9HELO|nr:hypothetical protein BGAL_0361g00070 [Botrytis galanthina]
MATPNPHYWPFSPDYPDSTPCIKCHRRNDKPNFCSWCTSCIVQLQNQQSSGQETVSGHPSRHHTPPESSSHPARINHSRASSGENSEPSRKRTKPSSDRTPERRSGSRRQELGTSSDAQARRPPPNEGNRIADFESSPTTGYDSRRYGQTSAYGDNYSMNLQPATSSNPYTQHDYRQSTRPVAPQSYIPPRGPQTTEMQGIQDRMAQTYVSAPSIPAVHDPSSQNSALAPMFNNPSRSGGRFVGWGGRQEEQQWQQQEQQDHQQYLQPNATQQSVAIPAPQTSTSYPQQSYIDDKDRCHFHDEYGLRCRRPRVKASLFCDITGAKAHNLANTNRSFYRGRRLPLGSKDCCPQLMAIDAIHPSEYLCQMRNYKDEEYCGEDTHCMENLIKP